MPLAQSATWMRGQGGAYDMVTCSPDKHRFVTILMNSVDCQTWSPIVSLMATGSASVELAHSTVTCNVWHSSSSVPLKKQSPDKRSSGRSRVAQPPPPPQTSHPLH